jgi:hypothetical protein
MIRDQILPAKKLGRDWIIEEAALNHPRIRDRKPGRPRRRPNR